MIKSENDFIHIPTNIIFPTKIWNYDRKDIYTFDRGKTNIGVNYVSIEPAGTTYFTIYVYPAGAGTEDRLRKEYINSMQSIANLSDGGLHAVQHAISYENSGYKINGFKSEMSLHNENSSLSLYECGKWFFKIRISSNLDTSKITNLQNKILDYFIPTRLVELDPLNPKADIYFSNLAFVDSVMLGSAMGSALAKLEWAMENVDSLERASGFPGLYLNMQIASLKAFAQFEKDHPEFKKNNYTANYLAQLNSIINAGYLVEFILEQFNMIMIIPKNLEVDFEGFNNWKKDHPLTINLNKKFYVIQFGE